MTKSLAHLLYNGLSLFLGKIPKVLKICCCCWNRFPSESSNQTEILFRRFFFNNNIQCLFKAYYVTHIISLNHIIILTGKSLRSFPFYRCEHRLREWDPLPRVTAAITDLQHRDTDSCSVICNPLQSHGPQHARFPCPAPSPGYI